MEKASIFINFDGITPPKTNMDLQNDGLEKVTPRINMAIFGISWYITMLDFWGKCNNDICQVHSPTKIQQPKPLKKSCDPFYLLPADLQGWRLIA